MAWTPSMWPSLPPDILEGIAMRLESRTEVLHLRAVCSTWRASIPLPPKNPFNLSFSVAPNSCSISGHFLVRERTIYCMQPLKKISSFLTTTTNSNSSWFVNIEETDFGKVRATAPFSLCKTIPNWDKFMICGLSKKVINLLDYKVREVGKSYYLLFNLEYFKNVVVGRCNNEDGFWVMFIHFGKLRFWKMGGEKWTQVDGSGQSNYVHIALHNGKIYAVDCTGLTISVDPSSLEVTQVASASHQYIRFSKYLVNSLGNLYLIDKVEGSFGGREPRLKVYKIDEERGQWIPVNSLGDQVILLMGSGCCCSVSAKDFAGLRRNCVYFGDHYFRVQNDFPRWPVGLFDLEDNVVQPLKSVDMKIFLRTPTWL